MKYKSLKICKYCHKQNAKPCNPGTVGDWLDQIMEDWDEKSDVKAFENKPIFRPGLCFLKPDGFDSEKPLPEGCPYTAEHAVEVKE